MLSWRKVRDDNIYNVLSLELLKRLGTIQSLCAVYKLKVSALNFLSAEGVGRHTVVLGLKRRQSSHTQLVSVRIPRLDSHTLGIARRTAPTWERPRL